VHLVELGDAPRDAIEAALAFRRQLHLDRRPDQLVAGLLRVDDRAVAQDRAVLLQRADPLAHVGRRRVQRLGQLLGLRQPVLPQQIEQRVGTRRVLRRRRLRLLHLLPTHGFLPRLRAGTNLASNDL
jgi:hypothetical protein